MSKPHEFQLSYTISPKKPSNESDAVKARTHMREKMGWNTINNVETTLLGDINLAAGTNDEKRREASRLVRKSINDAFKALDVDGRIIFKSSLMVTGVTPAIELNIP
ncbi:hypothetical protein ACIQUF_01635 [Pseudomonas sp. NPDC090233]|uniref:hypothetical protein n=1 Tax=Pseudomonas sp. NPDC090233 TaxID=3364479 RepID=UPI00383A729C